MIAQHKATLLAHSTKKKLLYICDLLALELPQAKPKIHRDVLFDFLIAQINSPARYQLILTYLDNSQIGASTNDLKLVFPKLNYRQRRLLTQHGYLRVAYYYKFDCYGRSLDVPVYNYFDYFNLVAHQAQFPALLKYLRSLQRQTPAEIAKKQAKKTEQQQFRTDYQQLVASFADPLERAIIDLAFWTVQLNHLAKTKPQRPDAPDYYEEKAKALKLFHQTKNPLVIVQFYRPDNPDKLWIQLCGHHLEEFRAARYYFDQRVVDYYEDHQQLITSCPKCEVVHQKDYYSLFHVKVGTTATNFDFHMPYLLGQPIFGAGSQYPQVQQVENEGSDFRFGRGMAPGELGKIGGSRYVEKAFYRAFEKLSQLTPPTKA
ncbi:hypothetical protein FC83_GL001664 [Agrilactobacillus composti DSM 18527 = JCM 14202]|uniref:Uncharacterized protein n=2 Tax=Agrilactobacillus TaxID=2767875 RepID=A0A0R1XK52_9LACO|nr:hypothetical protein FC83_GL001664 [Agrilactobacillus composti DSM 18527 = JCM 14202]